MLFGLPECVVARSSGPVMKIHVDAPGQPSSREAAHRRHNNRSGAERRPVALTTLGALGSDAMPTDPMLSGVVRSQLAL